MRFLGLSFVFVRPQNFYLSRIWLKNRHGHWLCCMSAGRKNVFMWRTHTAIFTLSLRSRGVGVAQDLACSIPQSSPVRCLSRPSDPKGCDGPSSFFRNNSKTYSSTCTRSRAIQQQYSWPSAAPGNYLKFRIDPNRVTVFIVRSKIKLLYRHTTLRTIPSRTVRVVNVLRGTIVNRTRYCW